MTEVGTTPLVPVFDGHNDTLLSLLSTGRDFFSEGEIGHIDLPRARKGGLIGGFFAVFVPDPAGQAPAHNRPELDHILGGNLDGAELMNDNGPTLPYAQLFAHAGVAALYRMLEGNGLPYQPLTGAENRKTGNENAGSVGLVRTAGELQSRIERNDFSAILHFEGAEMIDTNFLRAGELLSGRVALAWHRLVSNECLWQWCAVFLPCFARHRSLSLIHISEP